MAWYESPAILLGVRAAQALFALIVLGCAGYVASWFSGGFSSYTPSANNFLIFCAIWSFLALAFLILVPWKFSRSPANHMFAILGVEAVTMLFWFAGFIAWAVDLGSCSVGRVCTTAQASIAFGAFSWLLWTVTTVLAALQVFRGRSGKAGGQGGPNVQVQQV